MIPECTWPACQNLLPAATAGTLMPSEQARVTQHLATCAVCRQVAAEWRTVAALAQQADGAAARFERAGAQATFAAIQASIVTESPFEGEPNSMPTDHQNTEQHQPTQTASRTPQTTAGRRGRAGTSIIAFGAVALLIALAATIFALHGRPTSPATSGIKTTSSTTTAPGRPTPTPVQVPGPSANSYDPASIVSATNAWQIENGFDKNNQDLTTITHFDGQTWSLEYSATKAVLGGISMDSADDGWAVGLGNTVNVQNQQPPPATPLVLHYTHGQWTPVSGFPTGFAPEGVQMLSADDGWMFGEALNGSDLFHYTGGQWQVVPFAPHTAAAAFLAMQQPESALDNPNPNFPLIDQLHMVSDTEGWGLGLWHGANVIWHDHNGTWTADRPIPIGSYNGYVSIGVNAANDVWILMPYVPGSAAFGATAIQPRATLNLPRSAGPEKLLHFDGSQWQISQLPSGVSGDPIGGFVGSDGNWITAYDGSGNVAGLLHHAGDQWTLTTLPGTFPGISTLADQPDGTALAVALQNGVQGGAVILKYANGTWTQVG